MAAGAARDPAWAELAEGAAVAATAAAVPEGERGRFLPAAAASAVPGHGRGVSAVKALAGATGPDKAPRGR